MLTQSHAQRAFHVVFITYIYGIFRCASAAAAATAAVCIGERDTAMPMYTAQIAPMWQCHCMRILYAMPVSFIVWYVQTYDIYFFFLFRSFGSLIGSVCCCFGCFGHTRNREYGVRERQREATQYGECIYAHSTHSWMREAHKFCILNQSIKSHRTDDIQGIRCVCLSDNIYHCGVSIPYPKRVYRVKIHAHTSPYIRVDYYYYYYSLNGQIEYISYAHCTHVQHEQCTYLPYVVNRRSYCVTVIYYNKKFSSLFSHHRLADSFQMLHHLYFIVFSILGIDAAENNIEHNENRLNEICSAYMRE